MKKIYLHGAKHQIARHKTIRDINKQIVLNYIRARSPISRADIARESSLQRSTVSAIVDDLAYEGLIEEIGTGDSTGGRKPTMLRLRTGFPAAIGVDVAPRETTIALADLAGNIMQRDAFPTSSDIAYMNDQILPRVKRLAEAHTDSDLQVGISIPGIADQITGRMVYIPYFQWSDWDIGQKINEATGLTVIVENDANAVALAELWFGPDEIKRTRNLIVVLVAEGIGTGIIIDGQIYRGESGAAGEFGHMFFSEDAPVVCSCGRRDCWEAHASEKAILHRYRTSNGAAGGVSFDHFIALAKSGEKRALKALEKTAECLGIGISNLIIGFSPEVVIVSGSIVEVWDLMKDDIERYGRRDIRHDLPGASIVPSKLGDTPTVLGSVSLVLARKFAAAS